MSIVDQSNKVKAEADSVISNISLVKNLSELGEVYLVGSYRLNLMLRRELDINLVVEDIHKANILSILGILFEVLTPISIDYRNRSLQQTRIRVDGHWLKVRTLDGWDFDIWVISQKESLRQESLLSNLIKLINTRNKEKILSIKKQFLEDPENKSKYNSILVYDAVINNGVEDYADFLKYLEKMEDYSGKQITF